MLCSRGSDDGIKLSDPLKESCGVLKCVDAQSDCISPQNMRMYPLQRCLYLATYVAFPPTIKYKLHIHDI
jgi:hypothetical protein